MWDVVQRGGCWRHKRTPCASVLVFPVRILYRHKPPIQRQRRQLLKVLAQMRGGFDAGLLASARTAARFPRRAKQWLVDPASPAPYIPGNTYTGEDFLGPCSEMGPRLVPVPSSGKGSSDCTEHEKHESDNNQNPPNRYQYSNVENITED